jgi:PKD repeat protein
LFSYANACQATPTQFTDLSYAPDNGAIVKWSWDFGVNGSTTDTSTLQNPLFAYALPGTYTVMLKSTSESGCSNSQSLPVQIFNKPTAGFDFSAEPCGNGLVQFRDSSYSYQSGIASWHWEFEPFQYSTAQNPTHQYYAKDSCYNVKLMIADLRGCADTVTRQVCVPAQLAVSFDYQNDCFGSPTKFAPLLLSPLADSLIGFAWNFGDPQSGATNISSLKKPSHTFTKAGSYTVNLTATDKSGCPATIFRTVEIKALPQASFTYSEGQCDSIVTFAATTTDTSGLTNKYIWDFGDGTSDTLMAPVNIASHKFLTQGLFSVKLTVVTENGCTDQESQLFELKPCLIAAFAKTSQTECQDYTISFADLSKCQGQITLWEWNWGDTTQAFAYNTMKPSVTHSYSHPGKYTITLKVTTLLNGLPYTDSTFRNVIIISSPRAGFTSSPACAGSRVNFHNTTLSDGSAIERYEWDFGDQAAANDTSAKHDTYYTYPEAGDFTTRLVATNSLGCSDTATGLINVNGLPVAGFNYSVACLAHPVRFADHSDPYLAPLLFSGWVIRDSEHVLGHRIGPNMMFTFDSMGVYTVQHAVSDTNGCTDSIAYQITVVPSPLSAFSVVENYEDKQGQVHLENGSLGADEYFWDFGNGQTSDEASPVATFTEDGNYLIQLYSRNNYECTDSIAVEYKLLFKGLWIPNALATGAASPVRLWKPVGVNLSQYSAAIYNRKGEMIWSSSVLTDKGAPAEGWDGTFKDVLCPEGVYAWRITAIYSDGSIWRNDAVGNRDGLSGGNTGTVTLIR